MCTPEIKLSLYLLLKFFLPHQSITPLLSGASLVKKFWIHPWNLGKTKLFPNRLEIGILLYSIPANSPALGVSVTPVGQFLMPD